MKIYYNITQQKCPVCGKVLKKENDLTKIFFLLLTFAVSFFIMIAYNIIYDRILKEPEIPKIVTRCKRCPSCSTIVKMDNCYKLEELTALQKLNYQFRWWFRLSYLIGGIGVFLVFCLLLMLLDFDISVLSLVPPILVCSGLVSIIIVFYKQKVRILENKPQ